MDTTYWQKQGSKPLFPELEWNKPERRDQAGRLLIVGGNTHALSAPAKAYDQALQTGIGAAKIVLPDKTKQLVGPTLPDAVFLPSTNSGEFSQEGSQELLQYAQWADTILLPGDNGRNSQTTILFENLLNSSTGQIIATRDAIDSLINTPQTLFGRPQTTLVVSFAQLQKLIKQLSSPQALTYTMDLAQLVDALHELSQKYPAGFVTVHHNQLITAANGNLSTTKLPARAEPPPWRLNTATYAACYQTWYPDELFKALTYSAHLVQLEYGND